MAVPKRKVSRARRDKRRSQVWKLSAPSFSRCKQCGELKLAHRVCAIAVITMIRSLSLRKRNLPSFSN